MRLRELTNEATGLSPATLSSYKKKASAEASALDKEAFEKGGPDAQAKLGKAHKRYKGINKATQKQFDNDAKGVTESGPFSYGAKKPRKGSVADLAAQKRKEQERGSKAIEPKDQMVGNAKVTTTTCPSCHSADVKTYSDGEKECNHCHKTWDVQGVTEGWKDKVGAAALAGSMALGAPAHSAGIGSSFAQGLGAGMTSAAISSVTDKKRNARDAEFAKQIPDETDRAMYLKAFKRVKMSRALAYSDPAMMGANAVRELSFKKLKQQLAEKYNITAPVKEEGVAEGSDGAVSFREMIDVVDQHYPKYYAELSGSDISDKQFERAIVNAYKEIIKKQGVAEGYDAEELANEVYAEFERIYPNLARRADERTVHAAIMDVLNYGGDSNPSALAQDIARAVKRDMYEAKDPTAKIAALEKKIDAKQGSLEMAREKRKMSGRSKGVQSEREVKLGAEISKLRQELHILKNSSQKVAESQVNEISTKLRDKYVTRASDDYGHANFAARASKSHPGLEKYSQEQETRAKKRAAGLNRALSDKRLGRVEESGNDTVSFEVDSERAYNHIMDKFGHVIEWDGDAMVIPSKYWGAVQELAYAAGGEATEYNTVDEASLATMRDYFAGNENAKDEMKITQMRKYYANDAAKEKTKNFNSLASYHHWLKQVGAEKINRK